MSDVFEAGNSECRSTQMTHCRHSNQSWCRHDAVNKLQPPLELNCIHISLNF